MLNVFSRPKSAVAAVPAVAATAGETSSDAILVNRIAAGDKLAMQALFARHRTPIYRWLLRFAALPPHGTPRSFPAASWCGTRMVLPWHASVAASLRDIMRAADARENKMALYLINCETRTLPARRCWLASSL
jgi:hypothetical protein